MGLGTATAERRSPAGISRRAERWLDGGFAFVLVALTVGWSWAIADARRQALGGAHDAGVTPVTARIAAALTRRDAPTASYVAERAIAAFIPDRGASGKLRVVIHEPGTAFDGDGLPAGARVTFAPGASEVPVDPAMADTWPAADSGRAPDAPGVWSVLLAAGQAIRPVADFSFITTRPLAARRRGRIGRYYVGTWPTEHAPRRGYRTPRGLVEVTPRNQDTPLSEHFLLRDFLTKGQRGVWPKYVAVDTRLIDKLELVLIDLERQGVASDGITVMSGFRTPQYNVAGGDPRGRASYSRHMYGDAADVFIDNDDDGRMDDLDHNGRIDVRDAGVIAAAADRVERRHPTLAGGVGVYAGTSGHGPFVHIDTRGHRARWTGEGDR